MNDSLLGSWWLLALRGVLAIVFGVLAAMWPGSTLFVLVAIFAAYALASGAVWIFGAVKNRAADDHWWLLLLAGLAGLAAGAITMLQPGTTLLVLVLLMGANALVAGVLEIAMAIRLRRQIRGEFLLALGGAVSIVFGVIVFMFPFLGAVAVVWLVGAYAIASGLLFLLAAWRVRSWSRHHPGRSSPAAGAI